MGRENWLDGRTYVESGVWRCPKAPINPDIPLQVKAGCGAHHWVGRWFGEEVGYAFYCVHCFDVRKFPITHLQSIKQTIQLTVETSVDMGS